MAQLFCVYMLRAGPESSSITVSIIGGKSKRAMPKDKQKEIE